MADPHAAVPRPVIRRSQQQGRAVYLVAPCRKSSVGFLRADNGSSFQGSRPPGGGAHGSRDAAQEAPISFSVCSGPPARPGRQPPASVALAACDRGTLWRNRRRRDGRTWFTSDACGRRRDRQQAEACCCRHPSSWRGLVSAHRVMDKSIFRGHGVAVRQHPVRSGRSNAQNGITPGAACTHRRTGAAGWASGGEPGRNRTLHIPLAIRPLDCAED